MLARSYLALPAVFLAAVALLAISSSPAEAVAPANDNFSSAQVLTLGSTGNVADTFEATKQPIFEPVPSCQGNFDRTVWYRFTVPANTSVTVSTEGSSFDTVVAVYRATVQAPAITDLAPVACDDDSGIDPQFSSIATFNALAGATYYIQASGYSSLSGSLLLSLGQLLPNDNLANVTTILPPHTSTMNTLLATDEAGETASCGVRHAAWFRAALPAGTYVAQVTAAGMDPDLALYTGPSSSPTYPSLTFVDCNDDFGSLNSLLTFVVTSPATYYFQVGGSGLAAEAAYTFILNATPDLDSDGIADHNDNCPQSPNGPLQAAVFGFGDQLDNDADGIPGTQPPFNATWGGDACDLDDDDDGATDATDGCPFYPEDSDNWQDADGCEDPDNDSDGICDIGLVSISCTGMDYGRSLWQNPLGAQVDCRNVVEDIDSFHDGDGCPEPDNDYDNFPDSTDDCPGTDYLAGPNGISDFGGDEPVLYLTPYQSREDFDGVIDTDGCHDSPNDDYDGDAIGDETEVFTLGTDPVNPDTDADTVTDGSDNCPAWANTAQTMPTWTVPANDADCDGFNKLREEYVGTLPAKRCPNTVTANDEAPDPWPSDFNDSRLTSLADVILMGPVYNQPTGSDQAKKRFDLSGNGTVSLADVILLGPFYNKSCA
jgi:hypothetical protein